MVAAGLVYAVRVVVSLLVGTVVAPLFIASPHRGTTGLVRFLSALTVGVVYWMGLGFLLGSLHILELAPIVAVSVVAAALVMRRRRVVADPQGARDREASIAFDAMDPGSSQSFLTIIAGYLRMLGRAIRSAASRLKDPITVVAVAAMAYVAVVNLAGPLGQVSPGTPGGYNDLVAAKELAIGMGAFQGGVFPEGLQALAGTMSTLLFTDALNILRFMGVLGGLLLATAAGALTDELTGSRTASVLSFVLVSLTMAAGIGAPNWQLTLPLAAKWASAFVLVSLTFGIRYFRWRARRDLWVLAMAAVVASLIDPRVALVVPLGLLALTIGHLVRPSAGRTTWRPFLFALAGVAIGISPLAAAHFAGAPWSLYMWSLAQPSPVLTSPVLFLFGPRGESDAAVLGVLIMMGSFLGSGERAWRRPLLFGFGLAVVAVVALDRLTLALPFDVQDAISAAGLVGLILVPSLVAWLFGGIVQEGHHVGAERLLALIVAVVCLFVLPLSPVALQRFEPVGSGTAYLSISENYPAYSWTIISPTAQYSEVLGHGWHVEMYQLVADDPVSMAANRDFRLRDNPKLQIETAENFLYVYLQPFGLSRPFEASDFTAPLPPLSGSVYTGTDGAIVEAHALTWAKAYLKSHPKTASIYFRNKDLMVLLITQ